MRTTIREDQEERIHMTTRHPSPVGTLTFEGEHATLAFERLIHHPIHAVWEALTKSEHLAQWYLTQAQIDARPEGSIDYVTGPLKIHATGKILTWKPPRVFEHEWNVEPQKDWPGPGEKSIVRWELTPDSDNTRLRITHKHLTRQTAITFGPGIHAFLDRLENELDHAPLADWIARANEVRPQYPQWEKSPLADT